ncbi:MAG: Zn-dependent hydrolase [Firmicutes bacterium HGW-Firmicutes-12]|nr:MAG: Zn-dependent hydrolase [Firmicutes bacterium HGW-Firmicutes-12]
MKNWETKKGSIIYQVLGGRSKSFLISTQKKFLLIDTGRKNKRETLFKAMDKIGVRNDLLAGLVVTHTHFDHVENAASVKERYKTPIIIHKIESDYLGNGVNPEVHGTLLFTKFLSEIFSKRLIRNFKYEPAASDYQIDDYYDLRNIGINAYIIHTPGHTAGSISIIVDNEVAIVGDTMFGILKGSVFPPFANDSKLMIDSWKKLLETGCSIFLPAHGTNNNRELLHKEYEKYKTKFS